MSRFDMRLDGHKARTSVAALVFVAGCGVFGSQAAIAGPFDAFAAVSMRAAGRRSVYTLRPNAGDISSVSVVLTR
jgi:hypothetical protein